MSSIDRSRFLTGATTLISMVGVVFGASARSKWPRDPIACEEPLRDPDLNAPWHVRDALDDGNGSYVANHHTLSADETRTLGDCFATLLLTDMDFRQRYYDLIRTWKSHWYKSGRRAGGSYGVAYIRLLTEKLKPSRPLLLDDIADLHKYAVLSYRRALLALTGHDVDPDAITKPIVTKSFHYGPNDGSNVIYRPSQLGFDAASP